MNTFNVRSFVYIQQQQQKHIPFDFFAVDAIIIIPFLFYFSLKSHWTIVWTDICGCMVRRKVQQYCYSGYGAQKWIPMKNQEGEQKNESKLIFHTIDIST